MPQYYGTPEWNILLQRLINNDSTLTSLDLTWDKQIGAAGAKELSVALKDNYTLTSLSLWNNQISDAGTKELSLALKDNRTLISLNLCHNQISVAGAKDLSFALKDNHTLTSLNLGYNKIGAAGAKDLSLILKDNHTLTSLDLSSNDIGDVGTKDLSLALQDNRTLISLNLGDNKISNTNVKDLEALLIRNQNLRIHEAAKTGNIDDLKKLLEINKKLIIEKDTEGHTPLLLAALNGHLSMVQWLLQNGASLVEKNNNGTTTLLLAAFNGHLPVVQWLLQNGASLVEKNTNGNTALLCAATNGHLSVVQWLLQNGASISEKNTAGKTAFSIIEKKDEKHLLCKIYIAFLYLLNAQSYSEFQEWLKAFHAFDDHQLQLGLETITDALSKKDLAPKLAVWQRTIGYSLTIIMQSSEPKDLAIARKILFLIGHYLFTSLTTEPKSDLHETANAHLSLISELTPLTNRTLRKLSLLCLSFVEETPDVLLLRYQLFRTLMGYTTFVADTPTTLQALQQQLQAENPKRVAKYFNALLYSLFKQHYKLVHATLTQEKRDYFHQLEHLRHTTWLAALSVPLHFYQIMAAIAQNQLLTSESEDSFQQAVYLALKNQAIDALANLTGTFDFNTSLNGEYPLVMAVKSSNKKLLLWLLQEGQADIKFKTNDNKDLFMLLKEHRQQKLVEELKSYIHSAFIAAYEALEKNDLAEAKKHYDSWCSFDINYYDQTKGTLLCLATRMGSQAACEWLIQEGASFSIADHHENTPLMIAIQSEQVNLIQWLLKQPLDFALNKRNNQQKSANDMAMETGHFEIVQAIFEYNRQKRSPLIQRGLFAPSKNAGTQADENKVDANFKKPSLN